MLVYDQISFFETTFSISCTYNNFCFWYCIFYNLIPLHFAFRWLWQNEYHTSNSKYGNICVLCNVMLPKERLKIKEKQLVRKSRAYTLPSLIFFRFNLYALSLTLNMDAMHTWQNRNHIIAASNFSF